MKKSIKIVAALVILALIVGVSFLTFSSDSDGLGQGLAKKRKKASSPPPAENTAEVTPLLTIESDGTDSDLISLFFSDARIEFNNSSCDQSNYRPIGHWKLRSNMDIDASGLKFWTNLGDQLEDYRVSVGTRFYSKDIAFYTYSNLANHFTALSNSNFTLPANQEINITLEAKYFADHDVNGAVNGQSAMENEGVFGDFIGDFGNYIPRVVPQYVQNNQTNFAIGFTEINSSAGETCNK